MSNLHNSLHQDILRRLAILEGTALPPAPTPPPPAPPPAGAPLQTIDFTASPAPAGVTVARTGTNATRRSGVATVEVMAANTARYEVGDDGATLGLLVEKSRVNLFPDALDPGAHLVALGTGVTITRNYGTAPNGATQSTRIQVAAGNLGAGARYGISGVDLARGVVAWVKSTGDRNIYFRSPVSNVHEEFPVTAGWTPIVLYASDAIAGFWYNYDFADNTSGGLDLQVWGCGLHEGDTAVNTLVTSGTRPKEVATIPFGVTGTFDFQMTFANGATQNLLAEAITTNLVLDADDLTYPLIRKIDRYTEGTLTGGGTSPPPTAPPPSTDPIGFGPNQPLATVASFIETMTGSSDITAGPDEFPSQWSDGDGLGGHNFGGYIGDEGAGGMTNAQGQQRAYPWWVITAPYYDNPELAEVMVQLRWMRIWARTTAGAWFKPMTDLIDPAPGTTHEYTFSTGLSDNRVMPSQPTTASSGGKVILMSRNYAPHGYPFGMYYVPFGEIDCLCFELQGRLVPKRFTNGGFRWATSELGFNVGADWYTSSGWISEICHSGWKLLTNKWKGILAGTVKRPSGKPNQGPGLTVSQFQANPISLPPQQNIWIERGTYGSNTQRIWLRRSSAVTANKSYTVSVVYGGVVIPASNVITLLAGQSYAYIDLLVPSDLPSGQQQCLYITDGATEDIWDTFIVGSGTITG